MIKKILSFILVLFVLIQAVPAFAQYTETYRYVSGLAYKALENNFQEDALRYFRIMHQINPAAKEPLIQIRRLTGREETPQSAYTYQPYYREQDFLERETSFSDKRESSFTEPEGKTVPDKLVLPGIKVTDKNSSVSSFLDKAETKISRSRRYTPAAAPAISKTGYQPAITRSPAVSPSAPSDVAVPPSFDFTQDKARILYLTDELYAKQPKTRLQVHIEENFIIEGKSIKRFLIINPDVLDIERISDEQIRIISKNVGTSLIHIWDNTQRWTFTVKILPHIVVPKEEDIRRELYFADPFKVFYNAEWRNYSRGRRINSLERETLSFDQDLGFYGDTPHGTLDGSMRYAKYADTYELTNYTLGLTNGKWKNFRDFDVRIFDIYDGFSDLSYPGGLLRGFYLSADAFNRMINYTFIGGEEREGSYGYFTPGILEERDSKIYGIQLKLFPYETTNFSFNYAWATGAGREEYLGDEVYSIEARHKAKPFDFSAELAYDQEAFAGHVNTEYSSADLRLFANLRNIEKDFTTINGRPGDLGEIGAVFGVGKQINEKNHLSATLDVFRDRYLFNPGKEHDLNYDLEASLSSILSEASSLFTNLSYNNEPGLSFPRRYLNLRSTYSHNFKIFNDHTLNTFLSAGLQRSRNPTSPGSDYDVLLLSSGARYYLTQALSVYLNYTYHFLDEKLIDERYNPFYYEAGLDFYKKYSDKFSTDFRLYFRDEEESEPVHSFLAGEDSIEGSLRLSYMPKENIELYLDGRIRNVWAEAANAEKYVESEIRMGISSTWDTFFSFNPQGYISGYVFKDANANGEIDPQELLLEGITVQVGDQTLITDSQGLYRAKIKAKKATVAVKTDTLPRGYVLTTPYLQEVEIINKGESYVDFGVNTSSSISGAVFYDKNDNNRFDADEEGIGDVKISLDRQSVRTTPDGRYYFRNLEPGSYTISIDINTVPMEYLPKSRLKKAAVLDEGMNYIFKIPLKKK